MKRFTMFRKGDLSATHNAKQVNASDQPQFEGVVFSDGTVSIRWMTACKSTSVWASLNDMLAIHGHPEYGSELVWHDNVPAIIETQVRNAGFPLLIKHEPETK